MRISFAVGGETGRYEANGFAIYPNSLLFRSGDYPDKNFSLSPDELRSACANWKELGGNIQHTDFLKGRAAFIDHVWPESQPDGSAVLRGQVRVPIGLDTLLTKEEKRISMEWNTAGKFADGFALVTNPRISDAALMSLDENPTTGGNETAQDTPSMTLLDKVKAFFAENGIKLDDAVPTVPAPAEKPAPAPDPEKEQMRRRVIELEAAKFSDDEFAACRVTPAGKPALYGDYVQAALDDAALPTKVSFSVGTEAKTGTRLEALIARQQAKPKLDLTTEQIADIPDDAVALGNGAANFSGAKAPVINASDIYAKRAKASSG